MVEVLAWGVGGPPLLWVCAACSGVSGGCQEVENREAQGFVAAAVCLWLSLVLPKSGLGCHGNLVALIFSAWCALFPGFHLQNGFPSWRMCIYAVPAAFLGLT